MDRDVIEQAAAQYLDAKVEWTKAYALLQDLRPGTAGFEAVKYRAETMEGEMLSRADALAEAVLSHKVTTE